MPRHKSANHKKIVAAAKEEFRKFGFKGASMRSIAMSAGVSASGLYKHFPSKEDMFGSLVEPVMAEFKRQYRERERREYNEMKKGDRMFTEQTGGCRWAMEFIYEHEEEFRLLVNSAEGTVYGDFIHDIARLEEMSTMTFIKELHKQGEATIMLPEKEIHLLVTSQADALFEALRHGFTREEALHYADTLDRFFTPGWMNVMLGVSEQNRKSVY